jgi:anthranilate synthase component 1
LVRVNGSKVITRPIAGTRRRGKNKAEDKALERDLLSDEKERAEHVMLVDLGRNDIGRVSEFGSVKVTDFMNIEKYSHVQHIITNVSGKMRRDKDAFDALRATFPAGTVTGAPKVRAMEIIEEMEPVRRGIYAGAIGSFSYTGQADLAITIRTLVAQRGKGYIQVGAGIVADSVPWKEHYETENKARALLRAAGV